MATLQALEKSCAVVHIFSAQDINGGAVTGDYLHMKNYDAVLLVINAGALAANLVVTVTQCTQDADAGTDDKAIGTGKAFTFTNGTDEDTTQTIQIDAAEMDSDNSFVWLQILTGAPASITIASCDALCYRARWAEATMPSAIT